LAPAWVRRRRSTRVEGLDELLDATGDARAEGHHRLLAAPSWPPLAAAACSVIPGIGTGVCAAGAAVAAALTAAGVAISDALRDKFHVTIAQAEVLLTLIRLAPWLLFIGQGGIDNTGSVPQGAKLVRYLRAVSGEVPVGVAHNTGHMHNPADTGDCPDNPYLCNVDPAEPLTDPAVVRRIFKAWRAWQQAGSKLSTLGSAIPTEYQTADAAAALLQIIRAAPAPFVEVMGWGFVKKPGIKEQLREAVRHARLLAGESGPDPDPRQVLGSVFGGDVSVAVAAPVHAPPPVAPPGDDGLAARAHGVSELGRGELAREAQLARDDLKLFPVPVLAVVGRVHQLVEDVIGDVDRLGLVEPDKDLVRPVLARRARVARRDDALPAGEGHREADLFRERRAHLDKPGAARLHEAAHPCLAVADGLRRRRLGEYPSSSPAAGASASSS
jgi:hypothetical protein